MSEIEKTASSNPINPGESPSAVLELIYSLKVKDVMTSAVIAAGKNDSLRHIMDIMRENHIHGIPITENGKVLGIVSIGDIVTALDKGYIDATAEEKMNRDIIVLEDTMPLSFAVSYLDKYRFGRYPVVNKQQELVGILTSNNVIGGLLAEMNRHVLRLEKENKKTDVNIKGDSSTMEFTSVKHDFELAGRASTAFKKALKKQEIGPQVIRRVAVASYELEINQVVHSDGGVISCAIQDDRVIIIAKDEGPGIEDISLALTEGWSTASEWIRSLGWGAGMGLANTKRVSDEFEITSKLGEGTTVKSVIFFDSPKNE